MSQTKAQLVASVGVVTASSMTVSGVLTATTLNGPLVGAAVSIAQGNNLNVGVVTVSGIAGDITGSATSITPGTNVTFGSLTASRLVGNLTGNVTGNALGDALSATVSGITTSSNISVGVITSTDFRGDASNLDGVSTGPVSAQDVTANSGTTTIDLSSGNLIYMTQSADTTVSFANSENGNVYLIRTKDDSGTARDITWPTGIGWSGGSAPTLLNSPRSTDAQIFLFVTQNEGESWYGKEIVNSDPQTFTLFTWGSNSQGSGGRNEDVANRSSPVQISPSTKWNKMTRGYSGNDVNMTGAVKTDGTMWMWGSGNYGQLGLNVGGVLQRSSPMQVGTDTTWSHPVTAAAYSTFATKTDGSLWCWGSGSYSNALGLNTPNNTQRSSPTQIPGTWGTGEYKLVGGNYNMFAIQGDGSLWSWGHANAGQLGLNQASKIQRSSPCQIGTDTTWSKLGASTGGNGGCIKTDGSLWTWGWNEKGLLGQNHLNDRSSPVQVGTETTWDNITISNRTMMGIKTDGTLWIWGDDEWGDMGLNAYQQPAFRSSPTQLPGTTWNNLGATKYTNFATKTDGTAWSWGRNENGELGLNDRVARSSPTQIPGTAWAELYGKYLAGMGTQKAG